jgi:hypothetical protein
MSTFHPLFRVRQGTGQLYRDNRPRLPRSAIRRMPRGASPFPRKSNRERPWAQEGADEPMELDHVELAELIEAAQQAAHALIDLLHDVGSFVQRCKRQRQRLPREVLEDMGDLLDWYLVLHTVGLVDSRGVWLGPGHWNGPADHRRTGTPEKR